MTKSYMVTKTQLFEALKNENNGIYVLVACEESQAITKEFRNMGIEAYSADIQESSGGFPEWHICGDCIPLLKGNNHKFTTEDGKSHMVPRWNLIIAHPPCTYLTGAGNAYLNREKYGDEYVDNRLKNRQEAADFFMKFTNADADHIAIENPVGHMSSAYRKPNQIVHPWMWGDNMPKKTCLWTQNLPDLVPDTTEEPEIEYKEWFDKKTNKKKRQAKWYFDAMKQAAQYAKDNLKPGEKYSDKLKSSVQKMRSKTFPGMAKAIAKQWGNILIKEKQDNSL